MRTRIPLLAAGLLFACLPLLSAGDDPVKAPPPKEEKSAGEPLKVDYAQLSKVVHQVVVPKVPKYYEDLSGWRGFVPYEDGLRLPRLRTVVKNGERLEYPHGLWRKYRIWFDDPSRDVRIGVRDLRKVNATTYKVTVATDATFHSEGQLKRWTKGLSFLGLTAAADFRVHLDLDCEIKVDLDFKKFPPALKVDPKVVESRVDLLDFELKKIGHFIYVEGETARNLGDDLKGALGGLVKMFEGDVKTYANQAIAESLRDGKGGLPTGAILKALTK